MTWPGGKEPRRTTRSWSDGGKLKIFPTPRNLLNDMARRQRAKGDNKKLVRWGETKNIPNTPKPIE